MLKDVDSWLRSYNIKLSFVVFALHLHKNKLMSLNGFIFG